ncbi:MAG: hypothetical protein MI824_14385 [Hyphomicrobiales bacterium]|nr:hypothetical protein [Hyphomicrobiales bacterium]
MTRLRTWLTAAAFVACIAPPDGAAARSHSADGQASVLSKSVTYQVSPDHTVIMSMSEQAFTAKDASSPLNNATGPCFGEVALKGKSATGDGYCTWTDGEGQAILIAWEVAGTDDKGQLFGKWLLIGGKGKWTSASGGGNWQFAPTDTENRLVNSLTGTIAFK